jgi:hypothetical protein
MQTYSDPTRVTDAYALPDVEVFENQYQLCECGHVNFMTFGKHDECPECNGTDEFTEGTGWFWQSCFPGCLPDSDPFGPFDTEAEAIADAQSE